MSIKIERRIIFNIGIEFLIGLVLIGIIVILSMQLITANHKIRRFLILSKNLAENPACAQAFLDSPLSNEELSEISQWKKGG